MNLVKPKPRTIVGLLVLLILTGWSSAKIQSTWWDLLLYDGLNQLQQPDTSQAVMVGIDAASLKQLGRWPWSRAVHAKFIEQMQQAGVNVLLYDVFFGEFDQNDPAADQRLQQAVASNGRVVLPILAQASPLTQSVKLELPFGNLADNARLGHIEMSPDEDGFLREIYLRAGSNGLVFPQLAVAALELEGRLPANLPGQRNPLFEEMGARGSRYWVRDYRVLVDMDFSGDRIPRYSFADVLQGRIDPKLLHGKTVLVGALVPGITQTIAVAGDPSRQMYGLEIHADIYTNLAAATMITPLGNIWSVVLNCSLVLLLFVALYLVAPLRSTRLEQRLVWLVLLIVPVAAYVAGYWLTTGVGLFWVLVVYLSYYLVQLRELKARALTDKITGLGNRRNFDEALEREWAHARRMNESLALLMIDVDHFKQYNDAYGHAEGDVALGQVARCVQRTAGRPRDVVARYGGEEIAVLLPATAAEGAYRVAERIRQAVLDLGITHSHSTTAAMVTVSIGVAVSSPEKWTTPPLLVKEADAALYHAKAAGRNQVVLDAGAQVLLCDNGGVAVSGGNL